MKAKILLTIGLCAGLGSGVLLGRTWTSSDGTKTFEADFKSFDKEATKVNVIMKNGRTMTFGLDKLSEDDRIWIEKQPSEQDKAAEAEALKEFDDSELGKALKNLKILEGRRFIKHKLETPPEYYILYFSASW